MFKKQITLPLVFSLMLLAAACDQTPDSARGFPAPLLPTGVSPAVSSRPAPPSDLTATPVSPRQIGLAWRDNSDNEKGFKVFRSPKRGIWELIARLGPGVPAYQDFTAKPGRAYTYLVIAFNGRGHSGSNFADASTPPLSPIAAPVDIFAFGMCSGVYLWWSDTADNETGYKIERRDGTEASWSQIAVLPINSSNYDDQDAVLESDYAYRIAAFNSGGSSPWSEELTLTTPPAAATDVAAEILSSSSVRLTWTDNSSTEEGFSILRVKGSGQLVEVGNAPADATSFDDTGLDPASNYLYITEAYNDQGESCGSRSIRVSTPPFSYRLSNSSLFSVRPSLAWSGSEYGVTWVDFGVDPTTIYFSRVTAGGTRLDLVPVSESWATRTDLVWTGSEYGLAWSADISGGNIEIYFTRLSPTGTKLVGDVRVSNAAGYSVNPSLAWTGTSFGLAWSDERDGSYETYFRGLSPAGATLTVEKRISTNIGMEPSLAWSGSQFGLVWSGNLTDGYYNILFARLDGNGNKLVAEKIISPEPGANNYPRLVWADDVFGTAWLHSELTLHEVSSTGVEFGLYHLGSKALTGMSLVWTGSEYGLSWDWATFPQKAEIYFARITSWGYMYLGPRLISANAGESEFPQLAWSGNGFGLVWEDDSSGQKEVYFAHLPKDY